jgi:vacuolar-type H+-ATPase subunit H
MKDKEVLQQLLSMEKEASLLVNEAQEDSDRRIAEGEKQNRLHYEKVFSQEAKSLEDEYQRNFAAFNEDYRQQVDTYRESLKTQSLDAKAFSGLARKFLIPSGA